MKKVFTIYRENRNDFHFAVSVIIAIIVIYSQIDPLYR